MSVVALQNQRPEFTETFMLGYFYFKEFFPFFKKKEKKMYFWCNIVQIHPVELFINWNKGAERWISIGLITLS